MARSLKHEAHKCQDLLWWLQVVAMKSESGVCSNSVCSASYIEVKKLTMTIDSSAKDIAAASSEIGKCCNALALLCEPNQRDMYTCLSAANCQMSRYLEDSTALGVRSLIAQQHKRGASLIEPGR
ncbi:hypothetical protein NDU88_003537 [Pleurodeles waltl]|uniref:Uncharacterized protein n=1 Tax=Pleurodeles waltl TaxID=8319 RepID=A0AAV7NJN6_PLEWA|nr:hypothetical protein NDU88_003537 [Pleurodeles waltl]